MVVEAPPEDRNASEERGSDEVRNEEPTLAEKEASVASSVLRNLNVFRDFFLAAFSDGYHVSRLACAAVPFCRKRTPLAYVQSCFSPVQRGSFSQATFCGSDMPTSCCKGAKVAPAEMAVKSAKSATSLDNTSLQLTASQDQSRRRRKKPYAVAVGFNYAEDANGRPIIVTPNRGSQSSPIDLTNARASPPRGAPSLPHLGSHLSATSAPMGPPTLRSRPSQSAYPLAPTTLYY
jgi:hypothetical protein